ncbi:ASCH domain-containing protein [Pseudoalteromonas luteoviolacea]|uniref:ASCH domain-containing protein n=1 Tax=Pseudoalteromonas luteoviolacea S4054 TaxID=1129367 RepID=A0A0F6ABR6_9GAMM|nr:ASCH domain-containing protein [Pseudoalteromonas luteoviolacea]AOT08842.1 ASCH domain-containing protein [Pseudoalteromonas luteoviolacea]AOT13755.1 ASCH domain-containing protein [Pseudoalteromonas luteoviolacea]AOT18669.1 ASCH domain-containing protein [Pseudoalteromonas luteoviolacea]KKE83593.1 hypothetical protein N479_13110 [Pseudoalteromonas luteoviolacea S4054]KZN72782.1 hypothetical protein N481_14245 [Pseudoalteromonas luteoviolacea S4047-1]
MSPSKIKAKYPDAVTCKFGDSQGLCDELTALIVSGAKVATCDALSAYELGEEAIPDIGQVYIVETWQDKPVAVIKIVKVDITRFESVDEAFALAEGENTDLAGWRKDHQAYFERNGGFAPDMELVCEYFEVVEIF